MLATYQYPATHSVYYYTKRKAKPAATARPKRLAESAFEVEPLLPVLADAEAGAVGVEDKFSVVDAVASGRAVVVVPDPVTVELDPEAVLDAVLEADADAVPTDDVAQSPSHVVALTLALTHAAASVVKLSK